MLFRMIYDDTLAQAAYLIGCQRTGEAIVVDPERDVDRYVAAARKEGLRIVAVAETHIHADFVSGARELAEATGATVYVSGEGAPEWTSRWLGSRAAGGPYPARELRDGDVFDVGNIQFTVVHTPGHTPEHICYLVTDRGGGAADPMGVLTGDFLFVGDLGRPDLLETAAGQKGASEPSAKALFRSLERLKAWPEWLQVWPAHGAGSACGKALGAVPQSTVGYETRHNAALLSAGSEREFTDFILRGQPEPPLYFARMKRVNRDGPRVLGGVPRPRLLDAAGVAALDTRRTALIDTRAWAAFREAHVPGALFHPVNASFPTDAGSMVADDEPVVLLVEESQLDLATRLLVRVGVDRVEGWLPPAVFEAWRAAGGATASTEEVDAAAARALVAAGSHALLDVRRGEEFTAGHIQGAACVPHTRLLASIKGLKRERPYLVNCRSGARSARACALLERHGLKAVNLAGGWLAWESAAAAPARG